MLCAMDKYRSPDAPPGRMLWPVRRGHHRFVPDQDLLAAPRPALALLGRRADAGAVGPAGLSAEAETLAVHLCGERRLAGWYAVLGASAPGPALRQLFTGLAGEVSRRADASAAGLRRLLRSNPEMLPAVLRMVLWMTRTGDGEPAPNPRGPATSRPTPSAAIPTASGGC